MRDSIVTLHRYFIWADTMKTHFEKVLPRYSERSIETFMYMSLWYSLLYVVIEGWQSLKLRDKNISQLLKSPNTILLKKYRNACFHFHKKYYDKKFEGFYRGETSVGWVRNLNKEFGRYFLEYLREKR